MKNNLFYDGFNSKLIETAFFDGSLEMPILDVPKEIIIPSVAVPFSKRNAITNPAEEMLVFYEHDPVFRSFVSVPQNYMDELKDIRIISTPDCSLYRDMPLWEQIANIGVSRSVGYYLQQQGKYVIPNVRWGMNAHTQGICLIPHRLFPACPIIALYLSAHTVVANEKRINTSLKQDLKLC